MHWTAATPSSEMRYVKLDIAELHGRSVARHSADTGTGDIASVVAVLLVRAGYGVALHDKSAPSTTRRGMAFAPTRIAEGVRSGLALARVSAAA